MNWFEKVMQRDYIQPIDLPDALYKTYVGSEDGEWISFLRLDERFIFFCLIAAAEGVLE